MWSVTLVIALVFAPIIARTVRAAVLGEAQLDYVEAARLRGERSPYVMFVEVLPNVLPPILVEVDRAARIRDLRGRDTDLHRVRAPAAVSRLGGSDRNNYPFLDRPYWWTVLFPALAIASLVVAANLVSDSIQQVFER